MTRYHQLAEDLSSRIRAGVLRPGDRMPSVRDVSGSRHEQPLKIQRGPII
jgi:DNA-binding transcriptional regulator YhcF (GntR family)